MGSKTNIAWCDSTVNPVLARRPDGKLGFHCVKVDDSYRGCYAEAFNERSLPNRGTGLPYSKPSEAKVEIVLHRPALDEVLRWTRPRRVFWCSMTDLFGEFVPSAVIQEVLDTAVEAGERRGHVAQILTKRVDRMLAEAAEWKARRGRRLPPFVWLGFSAGDRERFLERVDSVLELDRRGYAEGPLWCSYEPAIGGLVDPLGASEGELWEDFAHRGLAWLIWGGESGARARPFNLGWARDVLAILPPAGVRVFGKQVGACPIDPDHPRIASDPDCPLRLKSPKGEDPEEWPEEIRLREFPDAWKEAA